MIPMTTTRIAASRAALDRRSFVAGLSAAALAAPALAQTFPSQLVRIMVPFSAGSMTDILARSIAEKLQNRWGQNVIVENRGGVAGVIGAARANDGHTLMLTSNGHVVIRHVTPDAAVDPIGDFVGVTKVASMPSILIAPAEGPIDTVAKLVEAAKARPGQLNYASAGLGSSTGIAAELFRRITGTQMLLVPFRGMPESQTAVLRGDAAMAFTFFNVGGDLIQSGRLRALAVTGETRMPQLPNVPTFREAGLGDFTYDAWFGVLAPRGTAPATVQKAQADIASAIVEPDMTARFQPQGVNLASSTSAAFDAVIKADADRLGPLVRGAGG